MADYKYLNESGLSTLWGRIKKRVRLVATDSDIAAAVASTSDPTINGDIIISKATGKAVVVTDASTSPKTYKQLNESQLSALNDLATGNASDISDILDGTKVANKATNVDLSYDMTTHAVKAGSGTSAIIPYASVTQGSSPTAGMIQSLGQAGTNGAANAQSALTANKIVLGDGNAFLKASTAGISTTVGNDDNLPTGSAIQTYVGSQIEEYLNAGIKIYVCSTASSASLISTDINTSLASSSADVTVSGTIADTGGKTLYVTAGPNTTEYPAHIALNALNVGDVIYIKETSYPDRWVSAKTAGSSGSMTFSSLETQDLSIFVQKPSAALTGNANQTITSLGVDANGKLTATYSDIAITGNGTAIAANDRLAFFDNSDSSKLKASTIQFDGSTTTSFLSKKGTWESADISSAILKSVLTAKGQLIYASAASTPAVLDAPTVATGSTAILSVASGTPTWDTITPISDATINALS